MAVQVAAVVVLVLARLLVLEHLVKGHLEARAKVEHLIALAVAVVLPRLVLPVPVLAMVVQAQHCLLPVPLLLMLAAVVAAWVRPGLPVLAAQAAAVVAQLAVLAHLEPLILAVAVAAREQMAAEHLLAERAVPA